MADPIWFWQRIVSPHMAGLAAALAVEGQAVTYVAESAMSGDRAAMGWRQPDLGGARLRLARDARAVEALAAEAPAESVHICQGLRGNGLVGLAGKTLAGQGLRRWIVMETVEDHGWRGWLRRQEYRRLFSRQRREIEGVLAIGQTTPNWLAARGMPRERIFPFTYFLPVSSGSARDLVGGAPFRILYVGQLIERKRVDLLIDAVAMLGDLPVELQIVGNGPLGDVLRQRAAKLGARVHWLGRREISEIPVLMAGADCLVLPSRYDGWGAVVSEALMAGTPAICSDRCGAAEAVRASGRGGVFTAGDSGSLAGLLGEAVAAGRPSREQRFALARWANCLGASAGARYLGEILDLTPGAERPTPPWWREQPVFT